MKKLFLLNAGVALLTMSLSLPFLDNRGPLAFLGEFKRSILAGPKEAALILLFLVVIAFLCSGVGAFLALIAKWTFAPSTVVWFVSTAISTLFVCYGLNRLLFWTGI